MDRDTARVFPAGRAELNVRETARRLGVHENTVRNWADSGILTPVRRLPGSRYRRFAVADVERLRREMTRGCVA